MIEGFEVVYRGPLADLDRVAVGEWPAGGRRHFRLRATMRPTGKAERYEGAELSFTLRWSATAAPAEPSP